MFSKYEQRCLIKIQIARGGNSRQFHRALLEACDRETLLYRTVSWWAYVFRRGRKNVHQCHMAIIAIEQYVRILVKHDAVDDICRLPVV